MNRQFKRRERTLEVKSMRSEEASSLRRLLSSHLVYLTLVLISHTSSGQICDIGYHQPLPRVVGPGLRGDVTTSDYSNETTSPSHWSTSAHSLCVPCNESISFCYTCHVQNQTVVCDHCFSDYDATDNGRNCTLIPLQQPKDNNNIGVIIGVVVGVVGGLVVVAAVVILVVCLKRHGKCSSKCFGTSPGPPRLPDPETLTSSYKDNQQDGAGQRDRYAREPGSTPPRVQSVQYEGIEMQNRDTTDFNSSSSVLPLPSAIAKDGKRGEREEEEEIYSNVIPANGDGEIYANNDMTSSSSSSSSSSSEVASPHSSKVNPTKGPGPTRPKPQTKTVRISVFPPDDDAPAQVYSNQPDSENDDVYVNVDVTQQKRN